MELRIIIQEKQIQIPELNAKFSFEIPKKSTLLANKIIALLEQDPYLQDIGTLAEKTEILTILQQYGSDLYTAILPNQLNYVADNNKSLLLEIQHNPATKIPWELLHNGENWQILNGGVKRIHTWFS